MRSLRLFLLALPMWLAGSIAWAEPPPVFMYGWGSEGTRIGEFRAPTGVAFDTEGNVVVSDSHNGRMQMFGVDGTPVGLLRLAGTEAPPMSHPQSVGTCGSGRIYVTDTGVHRVFVFERGGLPLCCWGSEGCTAGRFEGPGGVSVDQSGNLLIADWGNHRIQKLAMSGAYTTEWTVPTGERFGVTCDAFGHMYVADTDGNRILKYDFNGTLLAEWGTYGRAPGEFDRPHDVACDSKGNVYVADTYNYRIQKFSPQGRYLTMWGEFGSGNGQFQKPVSLAVNGGGLIAVADENGNRLQVFGRPATVTAHLDIMPGVCPNVVEFGAGGRVQIALLGTATFDALQADPATVRFANVAPMLYGVGDVSGLPADLLDPFACATGVPDGFDDLILTFDLDALHGALAGTAAGSPVVGEMTGFMRNGAPITAKGGMTFREAPQAGKALNRDRVAVRLEPGQTAVRIAFRLPAEGVARLSVHDVTGRMVGRLVNDWRAQGDHEVSWNAASLRSGVYFVRLEDGNGVTVKRFSLTR